jgi:hypothetical protein
VDQAYVFFVEGGFQANRGEEHTPGHECPYQYVGPLGNPYEIAGKTAIPEPGNSVGCAYHEDYENDGGALGSFWPSHPNQGFLYKAVIRRDDVRERWRPGVTWPVALPPEVYRELWENLYQKQVIPAYRDYSLAVSALPMLPYAQGTGHWEIGIHGHIAAFFIVPVKVDKDIIITPKLPFLIDIFESKKPEATGASNFGERLLQLVAPILVEKRKEYYMVGNAIAVGDVWAVKIEQKRSRIHPQPVNLTQTVTVKVLSAQGPVGAYVAFIDQPWTNPAPPPAVGRGTVFVPPKGLQRPLGKGYTWTATVMDPLWQGEGFIELPATDPLLIIPVTPKQGPPPGGGG